jgi:radical SAM superfamily enzyme YgiQ (UPF0313 family)
MKKDTIVFVAITDYDNLGVGYMAALLKDAGFITKIIDFRAGKPGLLRRLKKIDPLIVGFSLIFLNNFSRFCGLIKYLRDNGINCHFTAGGHYASLRHEFVFQNIPELDSIIRFEGEYPLLELAKQIAEKKEWKNIDSLAFRENDKIVTNPVRPPEKDLDKLPYPLRSSLKEYAFGKKFTTILAGRGCLHNCSFCNTREFYRQAKGPIKRIRKPESVAGEMSFLYNEQRCSVFIFHDDDFPVKSLSIPDWTERFCTDLQKTELNKKILWKINCRTDDVEEERFSLMKNNGLYLVFIGLEDGTDTGLKRLNKQLNISDNIKGISILKKLKIDFDYGFMLFQPTTTFSTLSENLDFLQVLCGDGYTPVTFLRLIPLYDTKIERELREEGRLIHTNGTDDYEFHEGSMNRYYKFIMSCLAEWQGSPQGLENISKWARNYCSVYKRYYKADSASRGICRKIKKIIGESNIFLLGTMKELAVVFETGSVSDDELFLRTFKQKIAVKHDYFKKEIIKTMGELVSLAG